MIDAIVGIFIVIPLLLICIAYSIKDLFLDDYNPYDRLKDIDCFDSLRDHDGRGIKRFLAAIKYEQFRKGLLLIVDGRNLILVFGLYFIGILNILRTTGFSNLSTINALIIVLPSIIAVILIMVSVQIKCLKKRIGN